jgi:hypothetical protein
VASGQEYEERGFVCARGKAARANLYPFFLLLLQTGHSLDFFFKRETGHSLCSFDRATA